MSSQAKIYLKFGGATAVILLLLGYLAYTGVEDSKSYYVTIKELHQMGDGAYSKRLRVAGNVQPGSIKRTGTHVQFVLMEQDQALHVDYTGTEAPPIPSKTILRRWRTGDLLAMGCFMPSNCKPSARRSTLRSRARRLLRRRPNRPKV